MVDPPWPGVWVADALGITLGPDDRGAAGPADPVGVRELVGLALRRNPRRAHLPVSRVLGKHVPGDPRLVRAAGLVLGHRVGRLLGAEVAAPGPPWLPAGALAGGSDAAAARDLAVRYPRTSVPSVVLGFAENGTALGHLVAEALDAEHLVISTRRDVPGASLLGTFQERHSHAPLHRLAPDEPERWSPTLPMVLVDDELSTGRTVAESLRLLHGARPRERYVVAALVDLRDTDDDAVERTARELGVHVDVVALARGRLRVPVDAVERSARLTATRRATVPASARSAASHRTRRTVDSVRLPLDGAADGARHGLDRDERAALEAVLPAVVARLLEVLGPRPGPTLVLGTEELHHLPVRLAEGLADAGHEVAVAATTRSPAVAVDVPGYAIRSALTFPAHDSSAGERYAYGLGDPAAARFETVVVVVDDDSRTPALRRPDGLLDRLGEVAGRVVEAVVETRRPRQGRVPALRGPAFGTFASEEVSWLVSDLSSVPLETPRVEREQDVAAGRHYSETLPEEHLPSAGYDALFRRALDRSAAAMAALVGRVTDGVLAAGPSPVLVSLARAGTPVGVLMRRWAHRVRGVALPHHTMSVVRGRGPDPAALAALLAVHDPASLVFVDGWTGTGGIADELATTLADPAVVVLADPGHAATLYGTREDVLIPSACLTATVCGLVSRTVRRPDLHGRGAYDGAKFYPGLAAGDRTAAFLDAVTSCFPAPAQAPPLRAVSGLAVPDRRGRAYVAALARDLGLDDVSRVKPGLGETTRVLLRRVPELVLLAPDAGPDADHLRMLCRRHDVPLADLPHRVGGVDRPYRSVGVIRR